MPLQRRVLLSCMIVAFAASQATAAADRFFVYNLTDASTFTGVYLAPAGTIQWGANQALNDKDRAIDPSERLQIKDVSRGVFDVKLVDEKGRVCFAHGIDLTKETTFEIRDRDLTDCRR